MNPPRRVGAETSKTRDTLLDAVEQLMLDKGYAAVTYRAVAAGAGVTSGLVQYYFPTLDDVFLATIRRRSEQNLERLRAALAARPDQPLHVLWAYGRDEATAALTTEFLALGNHRPSIRSEIARVSDEVRKVQLEALQGWSAPAPLDELTPGAALILLTGIPRLVGLEEGVGLTTAHQDILEVLQRYIDRAEPTASTQP